MRFFFFAGLSFLGRLPGILGSAIIGNAAAGEQWLLVAIIGGAAVILFVIGFFLRDRIVKLIARLSGADTQKDPPTLP
jgi:uncharacterized membrane protein YdjX (TVP38/TMEM64 family)